MSIYIYIYYITLSQIHVTKKHTFSRSVQPPTGHTARLPAAGHLGQQTDWSPSGHCWTSGQSPQRVSAAASVFWSLCSAGHVTGHVTGHLAGSLCKKQSLVNVAVETLSTLDYTQLQDNSFCTRINKPKITDLSITKSIATCGLAILHFKKRMNTPGTQKAIGRL